MYNPHEKFSQLLNQHLDSKDRSSAWLAKRLKVHAATVGRWRSGEFLPDSAETIGRIADVLGIHLPSERQDLFAAAGFAYQGRDSDIGGKKLEEISSPVPKQKDKMAVLVPSPPPQGIVGREELLKEVMDLLEFHNTSARDVAPVALQGMGGIGKTTLAIALGRHKLVSKLFPDGVLWAEPGPKPTIRNLLNEWGRNLGLDLAPELHEAACTNSLRSALYDKRMLLIIDDVWDKAHGESFIVAGPECRTLITTREPPIAYALARKDRTKQVDVLREETALKLLRNIASAAVIDKDRKGARRLCESLGYLPLALTLAGSLLADEGVPSRAQGILEELVERRQARLKKLRLDKGRLGLDEENPVSLQAILGMSVDRLDKTDQERFAMLSVFAAEPFTIDAVSYVWECQAHEAEMTISNFIRRGLAVHRPKTEEYSMHMLLADYASEMREEMGL